MILKRFESCIIQWSDWAFSLFTIFLRAKILNVKEVSLLFLSRNSVFALWYICCMK